MIETILKALEKDIKDNEEKLAKLKKDFKDDVKEAMRGDMEEDDVKEGMRGNYMEEDDVEEGMRGNYMEEDDLKEVEDDVDVDVDVEDDVDVDVKDKEEIDIDDESSKSEIEVDSELAGEDSDTAAILGLLTKAQEKAEGMGDEKLMDQIGNTITYYTRAHVVKAANEEKEDDKEVMNEEIVRFKKLAGLIK